MVVPKWSFNFLHFHYIYHLDSSWFKVEIWRNILELPQTFSFLFRLSVHWSHQLHLNTHSLVELHTPMWLFFKIDAKSKKTMFLSKQCCPTMMFYNSQELWFHLLYQNVTNGKNSYFWKWLANFVSVFKNHITPPLTFTWTNPILYGSLSSFK